MAWVWVAVAGAFILGGTIGVLVMAIIAAGANTERREPSAKRPEDLGIGA